MRARELLPFIDGQQEMVIRTSEGGKAVGGAARDIRRNTNKKEVKDLLDRNILSIYNHCWKLYIIVKVYKEMNCECELMK